MNNQKIENQLNLAMEASPLEREKSMNLDVGFDETLRTWEVIVKYSGTEELLKEVFANIFPERYQEIRIFDLEGKYAILRIPEELVDQVAALPVIEYMEKPKRLFFAVDSGRSASCINVLQTGAALPGQAQGGANRPEQIVTPSAGSNRRNNLTGQGVIVAVVDSGERVIIMSS